MRALVFVLLLLVGCHSDPLPTDAAAPPIDAAPEIAPQPPAPAPPPPAPVRFGGAQPDPAGTGLNWGVAGVNQITNFFCDAGLGIVFDAGGFPGCGLTAGGGGFDAAAPPAIGNAVANTVAVTTLYLDSGAVSCPGANPVTNECFTGLTIPSSTWVTVKTAAATTANTGAAWQASFTAFEFTDAGLIDHNLADCQWRFFSITENGGGIYLVPGNGASPMAATIPLPCLGSSAQTGCSSTTGDAGCVNSNAVTQFNFQATVSSTNILLQAAQVDGGVANLHGTATLETTSVH